MRQATIQLTVFADGVMRVKLTIIFKNKPNFLKLKASKAKARKYDTSVHVFFNLTA